MYIPARNTQKRSPRVRYTHSPAAGGRLKSLVWHCDGQNTISFVHCKIVCMSDCPPNVMSWPIPEIRCEGAKESSRTFTGQIERT